MIAAEYAGITFTATELPRKMSGDAQCAKCVFSDAPARDCVGANLAAKHALMPDCDVPGPLGKPVIYVRTTKGDVRQLDLAGPVV